MPRLITVAALCLSSLVCGLAAVLGFELAMKSGFQDLVTLGVSVLLVVCIGAMWFAFRRRRDGLAWIVAAIPAILVALALANLRVRMM